MGNSTSNAEIVPLPTELQEYPPFGLPNLGNTCYMSAALQCLFRSSLLNSCLFSSTPRPAFVNSYLSVLSNQSLHSSLLSLRSEIALETSTFTGAKQSDPSEFLAYFFDRLSTVLPSVSPDLDRLFAVETALTYMCSECKATIRSQFRHHFLSLPLKPAAIEISVWEGDKGHSEIVVKGNDLITAKYILKEVRDRTKKSAIVLVLQTKFNMWRFINENETLQQMELTTKMLHYYEHTPSQRLVEVALYHRSYNRSNYLRYVVKQFEQSLPAEAMDAQLRSELEAELGLSVLGLFVEGREPGCALWSSGLVPLRSADLIGSIVRVKAVLSGKVENDRKWSINVTRDRDPVSLEPLLLPFQSEEPLPDPFTCDTCESETSHSRTSQFNISSHYILIALQRYNSLDGSKDLRTVQFPLAITISRIQYELFGVIRHHGYYFTTGHYTSCVRYQRKWYLCDDLNVRELTEAEVEAAVQMDAYMLFYERV